MLRHTIKPDGANPGSLCAAATDPTKYGANVTVLAGASPSACSNVRTLIRSGPAPALQTAFNQAYLHQVPVGNGSVVYIGGNIESYSIQKLDTATGNISTFMGELGHVCPS